MKAVHLTRLSENIKIRNLQNFYAGHWCKPQEKITKNFLKYNQSSKQIDLNINKTISFLAKKLNFYHKKNFSNKFWRIVLLPYVNAISYVVLDRYNIINKLHKIKNIKYFLVADKKLNNFVFDDYQDFAINVNSHDFNNNIFFQLLKIKTKKKFKYFKAKKKIKKTKKIQSIFYNMKKFISSFSNRKVVFYNSNLSLFKNYDLYLKYFFYNDDKIIIKNNKTDLNFRNNKIENKLRNKLNFQEILNFFSFKYLPRSYLENLNLLMSYTKKKRIPKNPLIVVTASSHIHDDFFKIWYGLIKEKFINTKLFVLQYGSQYNLKRDDKTKLTYDLCDKKLNWGSCTLNKKKGIFIGANLNLKINKKESDKFKILYVCNDFPLYYFKNSSIKFGPNYLKHHELQETFLKNLSKNIKKKIYIKPYFYDYGWNLIKRIKKINKESKVISESNIGKLYGKYDLIITSSPTTTFLESVYLNIPVITLFKKNIWELNKNGKKIFTKLKGINIYFDNPFKAASYLNKNLNTLINKWHTKDSQEILNTFRKNYIKRNNYTSSKISNIIERSL